MFSTTWATVATRSGATRKPVPVAPPSQLETSIRTTPDETFAYTDCHVGGANADVGAADADVTAAGIDATSAAAGGVDAAGVDGGVDAAGVDGGELAGRADV
jgi:hypothetical protein